MSVESLLQTLPTEQRLALAYAPVASRDALLALLALDARLASVVRTGHEPILIQMRLAWWRERLAGLATATTPAEPLLQLAAASWADPRALIPLVDGWEALAGEDTAEAANAISQGRACAFAALTPPGFRDEAARAAHGWALADLATRLPDSVERSTAIECAARQDWRRPALPRSLRPLAVLFALARRRHDGRPLLSGIGAFFAAMRVGLFGI
ncbi:MAG: hypothetical protein KGM49_12920 [Sphingomonadales bacterium]|nr:hypothetical protein [Sphingomonadales bacterium]